MNKQTSAYKLTISVLFGLLGFVINFISIDFPFPPYTATILIGLLFPMLITLAWGWKYGLLAALVGGCQSMWWLWGPSNGYATFIVVPLFTLWIVWHGLIANTRRRREDRVWWLSLYTVEIPFRILSSISLFTLARLAVAFNPPPWNWASNASSVIPLQFSSFVVVKQAVAGCVILLLADVTLSFRWPRRFFGLEEDRNQKITHRIISIALLLGFLFWGIDSVVSSAVFYPESAFLDALALDIPPHMLYVRTFFVLACLAGGLLAARLLRKQRTSDQALQMSEGAYRVLADNAIDVIWQTNLRLVFTYVSPAVEHMMGYTVQEWVGTRLSQHASRKEFFGMARIALRSIKHYKEIKHLTFEGRMFRRDGIEIPVEITARLLLSDKGIPIGLQGTTRDVTKRRQAEKLLREAYTIIAQSPAVAFLWKNEETWPVEYVSENVKNLFGRTVEEVTSGGIPFAEFVHPDDLERVREEVATHSEDEKCEAFSHAPYRIVTKGGATKWVDDRTSIRRDDRGQITHYQGILLDITEREQAEDALSESEEKLRNIVENSTNLFYSHTPDHQLTFLSPQTQQFFDCPPEDAMGIWMQLATDNPSNAKGLEITEKAIRTGERQPPYELELIGKKGRKIRVEVNEAPVLRDGKTVAIVGALTDITERKRAEEEKLAVDAHLRQSQKLESIGTLASGVAHEINNPLMGMINYADLIAERSEDDVVKEHSQVIMTEGHRIAAIISNLLSFSRQDKERHSSAEIRDIIDNSLSLVGSSLRKDQITLDLDIPEDLRSLKCRSQQIEQVIINLLTNAHDALNERYPEYDENKVIRITARMFEKDGEDWIRTTVEDHGAGIPKDVAQRIFDPFFTTKSRADGTGLGLSVSFGIVKEHHGELAVESVPGEGTRFHIDLRVNNRGAARRDRNRPRSLV